VASWSTALGAGSPLVFEELARLEGWTLGRYALEARLGAERRELLRFSVVPRPLRETKRDFEARLGAAEGAFGEDDSLRAAARDVRARIDLLSDRPSEVDTTEFLLDPLAHCLRLEEELVALERGEDPWRGRAGDWWRVIGLGGSIVPYRVHAPEAVQGGEPLPLVIAFHGAGGDENMFMDAYGDGELARLAERHGFVAISPRAGLFSGNPVIFDRLVDAAADDWPIDPARIYVIGHSMGTGPTATLSRLRGTRIAACCCLSGAFSLRAFDDMAPMLMITGELDGIVSAGSVRNAHARAERAGAPVELRVEPHYGHTLIVGDVLAEVVDWLLRHRLGDG
jgi:predicted esterase